jgi:hypothetical protein
MKTLSSGRRMAIAWAPRWEQWVPLQPRERPERLIDQHPLDQHPIERFRQQHDPQAHIPALVYLVYPFISSFTALQLVSHVRRVVRHWPIIPATFRYPELLLNEYVLLPVQRGQEAITHLHDKLYQGVLSPYLREDMHYTAHLTLGRSLLQTTRFQFQRATAAERATQAQLALQILAAAELSLRNEQSAVLRELSVIEFAPVSAPASISHAKDKILSITTVPMNWST